MDKPDETTRSKAVCTTTGNFFTRWAPCSSGRETPCIGCNADHFNITCSCSFPATGLACLPQCQSGRWKSNNTADTRVVWGNSACYPSDAPSVAVCPAGTQVTGCGYALNSFWGGTNAPDSFSPVADGTACTLNVGKAPQACFKVWAACR